MKIAITAASGQLGSAIFKATAALLSTENVIGLARTSDKVKHPGVEIRPGDYRVFEREKRIIPVIFIRQQVGNMKVGKLILKTLNQAGSREVYFPGVCEFNVEQS